MLKICKISKQSFKTGSLFRPILLMLRLIVTINEQKQSVLLRMLKKQQQKRKHKLQRIRNRKHLMLNISWLMINL
ncbi:hypothetical protein DD605_06355 [Enterobacter cloacae complex sp. 3DZ3S2B]|nr:hypothetical protein DD603_13035 [Enterobacter cloacae complex sp. 2DZ2F2B]RYA45724.1 hypothetical protein DD605_06355 [Enterobacter cloacae complex sp. 3DZ3S2B]